MPELSMAHLAHPAVPDKPQRTSPSWRLGGVARGFWLSRLLLSLEGHQAPSWLSGGLLGAPGGVPRPCQTTSPQGKDSVEETTMIHPLGGLSAEGPKSMEHHSPG